ncbi:MAG TPA: hypothetical protein VFV50_16275, partial [Bdellovibrionales bacterium]|nr:hypothetical protein [Bdellovibrionales bacterium]
FVLAFVLAPSAMADGSCGTAAAKRNEIARAEPIALARKLPQDDRAKLYALYRTHSGFREVADWLTQKMYALEREDADSSLFSRAYTADAIIEEYAIQKEWSQRRREIFALQLKMLSFIDRSQPIPNFVRNTYFEMLAITNSKHMTFERHLKLVGVLVSMIESMAAKGESLNTFVSDQANLYALERFTVELVQLGDLLFVPDYVHNDAKKIRPHSRR